MPSPPPSTSTTGRTGSSPSMVRASGADGGYSKPGINGTPVTSSRARSSSANGGPAIETSGTQNRSVPGWTQKSCTPKSVSTPIVGCVSSRSTRSDETSAAGTICVATITSGSMRRICCSMRFLSRIQTALSTAARASACAMCRRCARRGSAAQAVGKQHQVGRIRAEHLADVLARVAAGEDDLRHLEHFRWRLHVVLDDRRHRCSSSAYTRS